MSDSDRVKGLLDGSMDPTELEGDVELYALAERIYGREALEEMGVSTPERPAENISQLSHNGNEIGVELPEIDDDFGDEMFIVEIMDDNILFNSINVFGIEGFSFDLVCVFDEDW